MSAIFAPFLSSVLPYGGPAQAAAGHAEAAAKAAFLFRFADYVQWPATEPGEGEFVIAVIASPAVARELRRVVAGRRIGERSVEVREARRIESPGPAAILFVGSGHAAALRPEATRLAGHSTLVVTDQRDGLTDGSEINFLKVDHRLCFEVSLAAAERARLKISAQLLAVAVRVDPS